jgi:multiple sugar transport system substrate-binding protein
LHVLILPMPHSPRAAECPEWDEAPGTRTVCWATVTASVATPVAMTGVLRMRGVRAVASLLAAVCLTGLTACTSNKGSADVSLTYWATQQSALVSTDQQLLSAALGRFTKQTGIKVHLEIPTWATLYSKILTAIASGNGPDVVNIGNTWSASLQATGALLPFDDATMAQVGGPSRFVASALASTGAAGQPPCSLPLYGEAYALFYNRALFDAAGITQPPATWAQFVADAKRLTKPGQWGVSLPLGSSALNVHFPFILGRQNGARLFDAAGKPQLASAPEVSAVHDYVDLMAQHVMDPSDLEYKAYESQVDVAKGKAAMTFAQTGALSYFSSLGLRDVGVAPIPALRAPTAGRLVSSMVGGTNVAVFKNSAHRAAALKLVKFLTSDAEQVTLNSAYTSLPVVTGAYQAAAFNTPAMSTFRGIITDHAEPLPMVTLEGKMETVLGPAVIELWTRAARGPVSVDEVKTALTAANARLGG